MRPIVAWLVAAGALTLYLLTINRWLSFGSLGTVATVSGLSWQMPAIEPLFWLVTYPFRWLPTSAIPLALNLFSVACGVLTLWLLARSVSLLPHDRTEEQRLRERDPEARLTIRQSWLPPVLAALVCGLQLTFWEHATVASSEILNLLLFAYIARCLLEFRVDGEDSWLFRSAVLYSLGMANNWAMIGFFPLFLTSLIWLKGLAFFNTQFLTRMFLLGLAGLSLYLLLPILGSITHGGEIGFWDLLRTNLIEQKRAIFSIFNPKVLIRSDPPLWVLGLPSLLPLLAMSIKWPSYFGDPSKLGLALATLVFNILYTLMLVVCVWVALDPKFSPRSYGLGLAALPFYYLGALSVGYYVGYFLLVFGNKPYGRPRPIPAIMPLINRAVVLGVWTLAVAGVTLLIYRNLPQIRLTNGPLLRDYARAMSENLPPQGCVLLSDDGSRLLLAQLALASSGRGREYTFLDTAALEYPVYHSFLRKNYPDRWPLNPPKQQKVSPSDLLRVIAGFSQSNSIYYLHPSFGYYFETFYPEPHGLVYCLKPYPTNSILAPPLTQELTRENEAVWSRVHETSLKPISIALQPANPSQQPSPLERVARKAHLTKIKNREAWVLGLFYSRSLNWWGVELQRNSLNGEAANQFAHALELNPENSVAQMNLDCNLNFRAGKKALVPLSKPLEEAINSPAALQDLMTVNGPFDEPRFCYQQGEIFLVAGNYHQAAQQFARVAAFVPDNLATRLRLAETWVLSRRPDEALRIVGELRTKPDIFASNRTNENRLLIIEVNAHLSRNDLQEAQGAVQRSIERFPGNDELLGSGVRIFMQYGYYSNALGTLEQQLKLQPDNASALVNKGLAYLRLNALQQAIPPLSKVIAMGTNNPADLFYTALLDRAIAYLQSDSLDNSRKDYLDLQKAFPDSFQVSYGLAEIAFRKKETNAAIKNYELYLSNVPTNMAREIEVVKARLKSLKGG